MGSIGLLTVLVCLFVSNGWARRSPNADEIEEYYVRGEGINTYSSDILEDAFLDVPELIKKYGYPVEVHKVITEDGYILEVHRIPYGRDNNNVPDPKKPVVLVMHGILCSSADWVLMGPDTALAYILAEAGYDVWLGNARGNYYSRNHVKLNPDFAWDGFWRFSFDEIGTKDLPAMIDYALEVTGKSRLHYIGHSQGTTAFFVMGSLRPEYNEKIIAMQAYAPVAYLQHNQNPLFIAISPLSSSIEQIANLIGVNEVVPNTPLSKLLATTFCKDGDLTQPICANLLFLAAGISEDMFNSTMLPVKLAHSPAGSSVRQLTHYGQLIRQNYFRRYNHDTALANWREYRSFTPPRYDLSKVTAPVFLHYGEIDMFVNLLDLDRLWRELGRPVAKLRVPLITFSHIDFMWGTGAKALLYDRTINIMKSLGNE